MILDMLRRHNEKEKTSFHMPGHKRGNGFADTAPGGELFAYDTTELCDTDALIQPTGAILEAEQKAAAIYGARHSFYLVNGASGGILAMLYAAFRPGDTVLIDRYCHQSVLHGAALAGVRPVYITPEPSPLPGIPGTLSPAAVTAALAQYPAARGLVVTSPNYYGAAADLSALSALMHSHGGLLLVDEAHGAHFPFSDAFPQTAMAQGADLSVTSLHKSLPAPNQTALLHMSGRFETAEIRAAVGMFQTSSPSYPLLAAMEQALAYGAKHGKEKTEEILNRLKPLGCPALADPFKLLPDWRGKGLSGRAADGIFREKFGIYAEMSTAAGLLLMTSWCNTQSDFDRLAAALSYCNSLPDVGEPLCTEPAPVPPALSAALPLSDLRRAKTERIPLEKAAGRVCAAAVTVFPPCIPVLLPGESITEAQIEVLERQRTQGARLTGLSGGLVTVAAGM